MAKISSYTNFYRGTDGSATEQFVRLTEVIAEIIKAVTREGAFTEIADGTTTPSVRRGYNFETQNTAPTTITNFLHAFPGQQILVKLEGNTTIDFSGSNLKGNGGVDWTPAAGSFLTATFDGTNWLCQVTAV